MQGVQKEERKKQVCASGQVRKCQCCGKAVQASEGDMVYPVGVNWSWWSCKSCIAAKREPKDWRKLHRNACLGILAALQEGGFRI